MHTHKHVHTCKHTDKELRLNLAQIDIDCLRNRGFINFAVLRKKNTVSLLKNALDSMTTKLKMVCNK